MMSVFVYFENCQLKTEYFLKERMVSYLSVIHIPATETRFFLMLIEALEINIRKRAQTISVSGLASICQYINQL